MEKEIVSVNSQLAKFSEEDKMRLFKNGGSGMGGIKESNFNARPCELKIIQKLTGDAVFTDPIDRKHYGLIFAKPNRTKDANGEWKYAQEDLVNPNDLQEVYKATVLKIEFGCEIYDKVEQESKAGRFYKKVVRATRSGKLISKSDRDDWMEMHNPDEDENGLHYNNCIRIMLTPYTPEEVKEMMTTGKNPFVYIELSGGNGWDSWKYVQNKMTSVKKLVNPAGDLETMLASLFVFNISSTKGEDSQYYNFNIEVEPNDFTTALAFEELVNLFDKRFTFFYKREDMDDSLFDVKKSVTTDPFEGMEVQPVETEEQEEGQESEQGDAQNQEDLPF